MGFNPVWLCLSVLVFGITSDAQPQANAGAPDQVLAVRADEIGTRVQILGRLGKPMGTMMSVHGVWQRRVGREKPAAGLEFHATEVDNRRLPQPVVFLPELVVVHRSVNIVPEEGAVWELRAFETGRFRNIEAIHWKEFFDGPVSPPDWGQQSVFVSELTGVIKSVRRHGNNAGDANRMGGRSGADKAR